MNICISPSRLHGSVEAPPSKSMAHRLLLCAGLSDSPCRVEHLSFSEDILATLDCLKALGAEYHREGDTVRFVRKPDIHKGEFATLPCRESGSTMRFFLPLCLLSSHPRLLTGKGRLPERPMEIYEALCREQGLLFQREAGAIRVQGPLQGGKISVPGNISSQFITGLLYALPLCREDSELTILPPLESASYLELTLLSLSGYGIRIEKQDALHYRIPGNQHYRGSNARVEGDYSNAAFLDALSLLGHQVKVSGLSEDSLQGDRIYRTYFPLLQQGTPTLSIGDCPDLGPILMAAAAALNGAVLTDTKRLKLKESDRGQAMAEELAKMGLPLTVEENRIVIPKGSLHAPTVPLSSHNDHRIAMSLAVLLTRWGGVIEGAEAVSKSYPDFFEVLEGLNAKVTKQ